VTHSGLNDEASARPCPSGLLPALALVALLSSFAAAGQEPKSDCDHGICGLGSATLVFRYPPNYPAGALRRHIEGWVDLELRVDSAGKVIDVSVVGSQPPGVFEDAAVATARRWRFAPRDDGSEFIVTPRVRFRTVR
jgi:TonB family protein